MPELTQLKEVGSSNKHVPVPELTYLKQWLCLSQLIITRQVNSGTSIAWDELTQAPVPELTYLNQSLNSSQPCELNQAQAVLEMS